jgi:hypothetical protein
VDIRFRARLKCCAAKIFDSILSAVILNNVDGRLQGNARLERGRRDLSGRAGVDITSRGVGVHESSRRLSPLLLDICLRKLLEIGRSGKLSRSSEFFCS